MYCGLVFYCRGRQYTEGGGRWRYVLSVSLGDSDNFSDSSPFTWSGFRDVNCSAAQHDHTTPSSAFSRYYECSAPCYSRYVAGSCPRGWGSLGSYYSYQPGCYEGSYYPDGRMETITTTHYRT